MYRIAFVAMLGTVAFAQTDAPPAQKPPAELERAVITRVTELFTLFTKHEYRKAEGWIAEESKDYYYGGTKPDVRKFEVLGVEFSDNSHACQSHGPLHRTGGSSRLSSRRHDREYSHSLETRERQLVLLRGSGQDQQS